MTEYLLTFPMPDENFLCRPCRIFSSWSVRKSLHKVCVPNQTVRSPTKSDICLSYNVDWSSVINMSQWSPVKWCCLWTIIMSAMASQITSLTIVYSTAYSDVDERKHQIPALLALCAGIHRWPLNSPHKGPITRKMFPFVDVIMMRCCRCLPPDSLRVLGKSESPS